jgi:hypothetical protein
MAMIKRTLFGVLNAHIPKKEFSFIDEIRRKEDAGLFLEALYDMNQPYKFIINFE